MMVVTKNEESERTFEVDLDWILSEINRDRSGEWVDYNKEDWVEGWECFMEGNDYCLFINDVPFNDFFKEPESPVFKP
ncbi:MAG: hypothetical protein ACOCWG_05580 [bacterium]